MNSYKESREIRIFISSTFKDMQEERDELVSKVFPLLRKMAKERQVVLTEIDLRWGITEEESKQSKVVQICLEEIEKSHPFFIGLLGGRYGWIPGNEEVEWDKILPSEYQDVKEDIRQGKSMTEIEILHGALRNSRGGLAAFYLRDMEDTDVEPLQKQLRSGIEKQEDYPIHKYSSPEDLGEQVIEDFTVLLDRLFPEDESLDHEKKVSRQNSALENLTRNYIQVPANEKGIKEFVTQTEKSGMVVTGETGMGKTSLLAHVALTLPECEKCDVISFFPTIETEGNSFNDMAIWFCECFEANYGFDFDKDKNPVSEFQRAVAGLKPKEKLYLIVDSLESIVPSGNISSDLTWWPSGDKNIFFIFSAEEGSKVYNNLKRFDFSWLRIKPLSQDQRAQLAKKYLKGEYHKWMADNQIELIAKSNSLFQNTGVYVSFLDELRKFGTFESLTDEIKTLSSVENIEKFYEKIIRKQSDLFPTDDAFITFVEVLAFLTLSENGMTEEDLIKISGITRLDLSVLLGINDTNFTRRGGKLVISNDNYKKAVENLILDTEQKIKDYRLRIVDYCLEGDVFSSEENDEEKVELGEDKLFELAFQLSELKDYDNLFQIVSHHKYYEKFRSASRIDIFSKYWSILIDKDPYRYDILNLIFDKLQEDFTDNPMMMEMYAVINLQSTVRLMMWLSNFAISYLNKGDVANRILKSLLKVIDNEHEPYYEELKENIRKNIAVAQSISGNRMEALRQYEKLINKDTTLDDDVISNIGEAYLSLYEKTGNEGYLKNAQDILLEVLTARIKLYPEENNKELAVAFSNYASAMMYSNREYGVELSKKSCKIYEKIFGFYNIDVAIEYTNTAIALNHIDSKEALKYALDALKIFKNIAGDEAPKTCDAHFLLAIIYDTLDMPEKALEQCIMIKDFMINLPQRKEEFFKTIRNIGFKLFKERLLDEAQKAFELELLLPGLTLDEITGAYSDLGKIKQEKGDYEASDFYYNKAIEMCLENEDFEQAQQHLSYIAQAYNERGQHKEAIEALEKVISLWKEHNLPLSPMISYSYFNIGVMKYSLGEPLEIVKDFVQNALEIRMQITNDENDEDLQQYRDVLKNLEELDPSDRIPENESNGDIDKMKILLEGDHPEILDNFIKALNAYDNNRAEEALHFIDVVTEKLSGLEMPDAYALAFYYQGSIRMTIFEYSGGRNEEPRRIYSYYYTAGSLSRKAGDYKLGISIYEKMARLCLLCEDYNGALENFLQVLEMCIMQGRFYSLESVSAICNCELTLYKMDEPDYNLIGALNELAIFIYQHAHCENENVWDTLNQIQNQLTVDSDSYVPNQNSWMNNIITLHLFLDSKNDFNSKNLRILLLKETLNDSKDDISLYIYISLEIARLLINTEKYAEAIAIITVLIELYEDRLDSNLKAAMTYLYIGYLGVHNFEAAEKIFNEFIQNPSMQEEYMEFFNPCYSSLLNNDKEKAAREYQELKDKSDEQILNSIEYYDLALYCGSTGKKFEAKHFFDLWWKSIEENYKDFKEYYEWGKNFALDIIEKNS